MSSDDASEQLPAGWDPALEVDERLVRRLLADLPDELAHVRRLPLQFVAEGWDNSVWRIGHELAARVPRRALGAPLLRQEARWSNEVTAPLVEAGVAVPHALHLSPPGPHYPHPWLLVTWVPGYMLEGRPVADRAPLVRALVAALPRLHRPAPADAPLNPFRGRDLRAMAPPRVPVVEAAREHLGRDAVARLLDVLADGVAAPPWRGARVWCHGDLHPRNLLCTPDGGLGVIDLGDLTAGDPAVDLGMLWTTFAEQQRQEAIATVARSYENDVWVRAQAWAARFALGVAGHAPGPFEATLRHTVAQLAAAQRN